MESHSYTELFFTLVLGMAGIVMGIALGCAVVAAVATGATWLMKKMLK